MRRFLAVVWCFCGVLVFPQILPTVGSNVCGELRADVGEWSNDEYATFMSYYLPVETDPDVAAAFNMLLVPANSSFDYDEFMWYYSDFMDTTDTDTDSDSDVESP